MNIHIGIDRYDAAFHRIAKHVQHEARIRGHSVQIVTKAPESMPDLFIAVWYGYAYWECYTCEKWVMVYDYFTWRTSEGMWECLRDRLNDAVRRFASNKHLAASLYGAFGHDDIEVVTDGIDTDMFYPRSRTHTGFRVGWVGNSNLGEGIKRRDLVEQVCNDLAVDLICADPADKPIPFDDMPDFYASIDALVIATDEDKGEGTPNPGLEAVAMEIPVFSTAVGIMPELAEQTSLVTLWKTEAELKRALQTQREYRAELTHRASKLEHWAWPKVLEPLTKYLGPEVVRPRVLVVYDSPGWCLERIAGQLKQWLDDFETTLVGYADPHPGVYDVDVVLALTYMALPSMVYHIPADIPYIVCQFDEVCWVRDRKARAAFEMSKNYATMWLFANEGMKYRMLQAHDFGDCLVGTCQDGVDTQRFPLQPYRSDFEDTPLRVLWVGNSDQTYFGDLKGFDIVKQAVLETGDVELWTADRHDITARPFDKMPEIYRQADVVVCMSRSEGTPNSALEGIASGRVVITTRVGITEEIGDGVIFVDRTVESLKSAFEDCLAKRATLPLLAQRGYTEVIQRWTWEQVSERYRDALHRVRNVRDTKVFLIHCGEPTVAAARKALQASDGFEIEWTIEEIENVAPMDAAFNCMLEQADTTFHVQVDADMVLKPTAINDLRRAVRATGDSTAVVCKPLWDTLFDRAINGVKIYRSGLVRQVPYQPVRHCEVTQFEQLQARGYKAIDIVDYPTSPCHENVMGEHQVTTNKVAFWNCFDRSMRSRVYSWFQWLNPYYSWFLEQFAQTKDYRFLWGYLGLIAGQSAEIPETWGEKDYRHPPDIYERLIRWVNPEPTK